MRVKILQSTCGLALILALARSLTVGLPGDPAASAARLSGRPVAERAIRGCANRNRRLHGLSPLAFARPLDRAARLQARNMARLGFFEHTDPLGRDPEDRVAIFDRGRRFTFVGENIAAGYRSAATACRGWMHSSGHRRNVLDPDYTHIGAGFARGGPYGRYYVQVFGGTGR